MFRSRPSRACWHFCTNCPSWPWDCDEYETDDEPPREQWCKTCVRMYEAGTGDLEDLPYVLATPSRVFVALCNAFSEEKLDLRTLAPSASVTSSRSDKPKRKA